jgi:anti-sigma B factor antagonist
MEIRERQVQDITIVELAGRLTVNDQPGLLKEAVAEAVRRGARRVLLDLSGVRYIDSTRLGELIAAHITVSRQGGRLTLVATPPRIIRPGHGRTQRRLRTPATVDEAIAE